MNSVKTEDNTGWRAFLTYGIAYRAVQWVFSEKRSKQFILENYVAPLGDNCSVLDMGCGPGNLLSYLPAHVDYVGFDVNEEYIGRAKQLFSTRENTNFYHCSAKAMMELEAVPDGSIDLVIIHGVFHHIPDEVVAEMLALADKKLRQGGRLLALEPVWFEGQSKLRESVMKLDRGNNIKTQQAWQETITTMSESWADSEFSIQPNLIRFYDLMAISLTKR